MVKICALWSWSNGNAYYIWTEDEAILIDCGISYRMLNSRAEKLWLDLKKVKAVIISHSHTDHIRWLPRFHKMLPEVPIFFNGDEIENVKEEDYQIYKEVLEDVTVDDFEVGKFHIYPFLKSHDTEYPLSFRVEIEGKNIGVFTDIGKVEEDLEENFSQCDAVFLETNYHSEMLKYGPYPIYLKNRVQETHLSNDEAFNLVKRCASPNLKILIFSHISKDNNSYEKIMEQFHSFEQIQMSIATREECGELFEF